ncbi:amidase [Bradyrhizobium sp. AUGA SZCCT0240]|uniref:amidase family protein n=1 Tax=unclassified Bradyrhizobium TaxID=2631580 RepID=UPI001BA5B7AD|nr:MULTISPECIES: amidase family protein [unclassified Bradyrhizobium]MBR1193889.1 amidase [Bradyrhizobium sp. AUGA SZCCT0160]MBR1200810.1 amidase [Bradyrhizobium sp. AUGA SZCCT0158]MBR1245145.1 amidase [Bradyrhizobium sp. AUGA SZCCT0274]MBR1258732.1 amidase [Bradyrhizobium sp. AUGA SZCCT0240]
MYPTSVTQIALQETTDLTSLGLGDAAAAVRNGDITSESYTAALLQHARALAELNAFTTINEDAVLEAARDADKAHAAGLAAPLLGVPLGVKDSYLTKGLPTSLGLDSLAHFIPREDADAVRAIKEAGAIVFGKNNLVEMSYGLTGHNERYGQVKNPHARDRVTGGSSSGSAASVAAGIVPASLGGDTVGSIRVPASFCGVVGFKPTTGRWPRTGVAPISHTLDTTGAFARSVQDCILVDQVVTGEQAAESFARGYGLKGARLAFAPRQFLDLLDSEVEIRFREVVRRLQDAGAEIVEVDLGDDFNALIQTSTWGIFAYETMGAISGFLRRHDIPTTFEAIYESLKPQLRQTWGHIVLPGGAAATSAEDYQTALNVSRPEIQRRLNRAFVSHGALAILQPTTPCTAPLIEEQTTLHIAGQEVSYLALANHTVSASSVGLPGISLPAGLSRAGLPIGLELDAPLAKDRILLNISRRIEAVLRT